jgi:DNA end-binding protein Ku
MRAIWSGALSFGLVNIPVKLFSAVNREAELDLDMIHGQDMGRIRYARVCRLDGKEVPYEDIVKGYQYREGDYIILTEEDFKRASAKKTQTIEVLEFVKEKEVDPIFFEKPYFLAPQKGAERPYLLLMSALKKTGRAGIGRFVMRHREHIAMITPKRGVISLIQLRFEKQIRSSKELIPKEKPLAKKAELDLAITLIDQLTKEFEPSRFKDSYTGELRALIEKKAKGKDIQKTPPEPQFTEAQDIMKMLRQSLERERERAK